MSKTVITYGTFDLFHIGHLRLLTRIHQLGDRVVVAVSTDEFNKEKGKRTIIRFEDRAEIVASLRVVDEVIPERSWEQKENDIRTYRADIFAIGDDWRGKFDNLSRLCEVKYLPRTEGISSTYLKQHLRGFDQEHIENMKEALATMSSIIDRLR